MTAISRPTHHTAAVLLTALTPAFALVACGGGSGTTTKKTAANQIPAQARPLIHPCQVLPASAVPPNEKGLRPTSCNASSDLRGDETGDYTYPGDRKPALEIGISRDPQHTVWRVATEWVHQKQARYGPTVDGAPTIYNTSQGGLLVSKRGAYHIAIVYFRAQGTPVNEVQSVKILRALLPRMPS